MEIQMVSVNNLYSHYNLTGIMSSITTGENQTTNQKRQ